MTGQQEKEFRELMDAYGNFSVVTHSASYKAVKDWIAANFQPKESKEDVPRGKVRLGDVCSAERMWQDCSLNRPAPSKQRPIYVRCGDWYILHEGKSEIKAFGNCCGETTAVIHNGSDVQYNEPFPDFCDRMRSVAELVG